MSPIPMRSSGPPFIPTRAKNFDVGRKASYSSISTAASPPIFLTADAPAQGGPRQPSCLSRSTPICERHERPAMRRLGSIRSTLAMGKIDRHISGLSIFASRTLPLGREECSREIGSGPVTLFSRLIGGVGIGVRLDRLAIEMPRRVAEHRNHHCKADEERHRSDHQ
jgi:hypothetical protein